MTAKQEQQIATLKEILNKKRLTDGDRFAIKMILDDLFPQLDLFEQPEE